MSVSYSNCFPDLLCGEETSTMFSGDDLPECSSEVESQKHSEDLEESIIGLIEHEKQYVPGIDYLERFQSQSLDASTGEDSVAWILKVQRYYGFQPLTAYLSVNYFDRVLYSRRLPLCLRTKSSCFAGYVRKITICSDVLPDRYGYKDVRKKDHHAFEQLLVESLEKFLRKEAQHFALESNLQEEAELDSISMMSRESGAQDGDGIGEVRIPLIHDQKLQEEAGTSLSQESASALLPASVMSVDEDPSLEYELSALKEATESGFTYLLGHDDVRAKKSSWFVKKFVINYFYVFLRKNCRGGAATMRVPHTNVMQVGMTYMV